MSIVYNMFIMALVISEIEIYQVKQKDVNTPFWLSGKKKPGIISKYIERFLLVP